MEPERSRQHRFHIPRLRHFKLVNQKSLHGFTVCKGFIGSFSVEIIKNQYGRIMLIHGFNHQLEQTYLNNLCDIEPIFKKYNLDSDFVLDLKMNLDAVFRQRNL